jgi:hypothetical protein
MILAVAHEGFGGDERMFEILFHSRASHDTSSRFDRAYAAEGKEGHDVRRCRAGESLGDAQTRLPAQATADTVESAPQEPDGQIHGDQQDQEQCEKHELVLCRATLDEPDEFAGDA